jgi:hypothetical protein
VQDDAPDEVVLCKASPHTRLVTRLGGLVACEMERPRVGGKARERFEELDDPFPGKPIGNREKRCSAPVTKVAQRTIWWRCHVPARRDDSDPRLREPIFDELRREVVARGEQDVCSPQREAIQRGLNPGSRCGVVDAAGRLMQNGDEWNCETAHRQSRTYERSCDRVEKYGACLELLRQTKHRSPT